jgi:hypothetical protein
MAAQAFNLTFNCTPAQFAVAMATTLPIEGYTVIQAPNKFAGIITGTSSAAAGLGQLDFFYDGAYYLRFFGANPAPVAQQAPTGIPTTQLTSNIVSNLTTTLAATLGAPVPSNTANVAGPAA